MIENIRYMDIVKKMELAIQGPAAGSLIWKPKGAKLYENLRNFILKEHLNSGYLQVKSPSLVDKSLFERSGHSIKYQDNIFYINDLALRPMSCPNHIALYESEHFSFRDLPIKYFEFGEVFRNESSGSLQMLFRQRQFCQDDSHIFAKPSDIKGIVINYLQLSANIYKKLGFENLEYVISLRPEQRFGSDELWDIAEKELMMACDDIGIKYSFESGGAFYGPKIELKVKDKMNRNWQLGVVQLDYVLPERFELKYYDENNKPQSPVIIHHAILGSLERMIGILLEVFGANIPEFLHPVKAIVLPVSESINEYAKKVKNALDVKNIYELDDCIINFDNMSLNKKIALASSQLIPNVYIVGKKEFDEYEKFGVIKAMLRKNGENKMVTF